MWDLVLLSHVRTSRGWRRLTLTCQALSLKEDGEHLNTWSQIKQEDPLNLSISISGGKETNRDSPSNGEWSGNSSILESHSFRVRIVVSRGAFGGSLGLSPLERGIKEGENPVFDPEPTPMWCVFKESDSLGMLSKMGGKYHLKLNIGERPIANKYREGKMKRTLKRELNSTWNCQKGNAWNQYCIAEINCLLRQCTFRCAGQHQFSLEYKAGQRWLRSSCQSCSGEDWGLQLCIWALCRHSTVICRQLVDCR